MNGYQFWSSIVHSLSWPAAAVGVTLVLRQAIMQQARRLQRIKWRDLEAELHLAEQVAQTGVSAEEIGEIVGRALAEAKDDDNLADELAGELAEQEARARLRRQRQARDILLRRQGVAPVDPDTDVFSVKDDGLEAWVVLDPGTSDQQVQQIIEEAKEAARRIAAMTSAERERTKQHHPVVTFRIPAEVRDRFEAAAATAGKRPTGLVIEFMRRYSEDPSGQLAGHPD